MAWRPLQETFFPLNFLESSRGLSGEEEKKRQKTEAQKALGNPGQTDVVETLRVKCEFWLKDLADIPLGFVHKINKIMSVRNEKL